ncbi:DHA2 family efflux MFS transporter permease subunit [Chelatococcus reniformis]|uniref:MFS transporter n=1 Tax=Chelatococcus reniformis TaxID=1494448 RepID=A0A916UT23_9HYPH|nr:DHA2 family efflux MFS transporter permease subunit [Chelatococcus reniformis]GGC85559.1 MFS transporter [Chelatococcus reniformis]
MLQALSNRLAGVKLDRQMLIPLIVACALFMENTDSTVIATSLPAIAADIGEDPIALKLALTSYLVSLAIFIPISGWMADRFGARTVFRLAIVVFMGGSLACAFSNSLGSFVAARFLQGIGGSMMVPVGRLVLLRSIPKSQLVSALAYLTVPALVGPVVGPPLGGFITTYFDWRWIFFINIPIGILGIVLASVFIENIREEDVVPLDIGGFVLAGFGFAALMMGFASGGRHLIPPGISVALAVAGAVSLVLYYVHSRRVAAPLLKLDLLKIPTFRANVVAGSLFRIGVGAIPFLLPLMLQLGFGLSPVQSGLITFISAVGALFMKTLATRVLRRYGFRTVLTVNAVLASATLAIYGFFTPTTSMTLMLAVLFAGGCLRSLQFTAINAIGYADVEPRDMSYATSLSSVAQQLSLSFGVALGALVLQFASDLSGHTEIRTEDFWPAFVVVAAVSASSALVTLFLARDAGTEVSGHVPRERVAAPGGARRLTAEAVQQHPTAGET